jgi:uncharacterized protein YbjT (DUF2867 family)
MARVVVVAGGTGLVGTQLVQQLLSHDGVSRVVCVGRRAPALTHGKLESRVVADLARLKDDDLPKDATDAYCALGTTRAQAGSAQAARHVDVDLVLAFAKACRTAGVLRFSLVSAAGADARSMLSYNRCKGEAEAGVRALRFDVVHIARPSILAGDRQQHRRGERLGLAVVNALERVLGSDWRYAAIADHVVARALIRAMDGDAPGVFVHESNALQRLGAQPLAAEHGA